MYRVLLSLFFAYLVLPTYAQTDQSHVLLISFDGFRADYVQKFQPPNFLKFIEEGAQAEALVPSYPSKTFPNHYTLVTGLYPGHHGLVDNTFLDPGRDVIYKMSKSDLVKDPYFYGGFPLWQWVQEYSMKSASYFWVGSEAPIKGRYPDIYNRYDGSVPNTQRVKTVLQWFSMPDSARPRFVSLYFSLVDSEGHRSGPDSEGIKEAVLEADRLLGQLMNGLNRFPFSVNVIITSDHGMYKMEKKPDTHISMSKVLEGLPQDLRVLENGTHVHIFVPDDQEVQKIYETLTERETNFKAYRRENTPVPWHYRDSDRIGDIFLVAHAGHVFRGAGGFGSFRSAVWGTHGFDPYLTPEMNGILYARGPGIKKGARIGPLENIHVFPLVTELLGLPLPAIDGKVSAIQPLLQE
ncbi:MAG: ectonucleotide pyrophosphatase/phosphodiesterase [Bacteroidota bacterium]